MTVRFSPTASDLGTIGQDFDIPSNDPDENPVTVNVSGTAVTVAAPNISISPSSIGFGTDTDCNGIIRTATISNTGSGSLNITSITIIDSPNFSIQSNTCPASLGAGSSCTVDVEFLSTTGGGAKSGTLVIQSNDPDTPTVNVGLSGTRVNLCP